MWFGCGNESWSLGAWWWLLPLACMILCVLLCRLFRRRWAGIGPCGWRGDRRAEMGAMKDEIKKLREEIDRMKGKGEK